MKISLAWVFDHIDADVNTVNVEELVTKFNRITAEIEHVETFHVDLGSFYMGTVISCEESKVTVVIPELKEKTSLDARSDAKIDQHYLLFRDDKGMRWATCKDVKLDKEGLLPPFDVATGDLAGGWREHFESEDHLLDVDNKSLTHRPDMWGHRGFAREIAAFLTLPLRDKMEYLAAPDRIPSKQGDFSIEIRATHECFRFAGLHIESIENKPSNLRIASRLIKVGVRPINAIVDLTNYVMFDWSQPLHAYDAKKIRDKKLIARMAAQDEALTMLDGTELSLTTHDLVIADGKLALGLAGIMGGKDDSISEETSSIFLESASFDAATIRRTSHRYGIRTDASIRFEKTLDRNQITDAILRFVALCDATGLEANIPSEMIVVGEADEEKVLGVLHSFLECRLGVRLDKDDVIEPLTRLGFAVTETVEESPPDEDVLYTITIPSFRSSKDIEIQEDILEEVVRFFGFDRIALTPPALHKQPGDLAPLFRLRKLKSFLVEAAHMTEQRNYFYYDESFLKEVGLDFTKCLRIKNPISEDNVRLVSSLLPNLFKNIKQNCKNEQSLRFFEEGRICCPDEEKSLAGVIFEKRQTLDFYYCKGYIEQLCKICGMDGVVWKKMKTRQPEQPWIALYQSAELLYQNKKIGVAGKVDNAFLMRLDALPESDAFFFELNADLLLAFRKEDVIYSPISKFQDITFDLSFMVPSHLTVDELESVLFESSELIEKVALIDFFDKEEWVNQRSLAFRLWVSHPERTLTKEDVELVRFEALSVSKKLGAQIRE